MKENSPRKGNLSTTLSIIGVSIAVVSAVLTFLSFNEHKRITSSQVYFEIQKLSLQTFSDPDKTIDLHEYAKRGPKNIAGRHLDAVMLSFRTVMYLNYIAFRQHEFGNISEEHWTVMTEELCKIATSPGGRHYFSTFPLKNAPYVDGFKEFIKSCPP